MKTWFTGHTYLLLPKRSNPTPLLVPMNWLATTKAKAILVIYSRGHAVAHHWFYRRSNDELAHLRWRITNLVAYDPYATDCLSIHMSSYCAWYSCNQGRCPHAYNGTKVWIFSIWWPPATWQISKTGGLVIGISWLVIFWYWTQLLPLGAGQLCYTHRSVDALDRFNIPVYFRSQVCGSVGCI